jgi:hypothetical protein
VPCRLGQKAARFRRIGLSQVNSLLITRNVDEELKLQIVGIAKYDGWPVSGVDDSGVTDALLVKVRNPFAQFDFIRNPERYVVQTNAPLVEFVGRRGPIVTHDGHADA